MPAPIPMLCFRNGPRCAIKSNPAADLWKNLSVAASSAMLEGNSFAVNRACIRFVTTGHSRSQNSVASLAYAGGPW
jgi:hypothetical protein